MEGKQGMEKKLWWFISNKMKNKQTNKISLLFLCRSGMPNLMQNFQGCS